MARWLEDLVGLFRGPRPRPLKSSDRDASADSFTLVDYSSGSSGGSASLPDVPPSESPKSFDGAFDGGESGGGGASSDYAGGWDAGGWDSGGGDSGGGGGD